MSYPMLNALKFFESMAQGHVCPKLGRDELPNGLIVSTVRTPDEGLETAIINTEGTHVVERYETDDKANAGHSKWVEFAKDGIGKTVKSIGWSDIGNDSEVTL